jgi:hypothetical protein
MSTYTIPDLIHQWAKGDLTAEQAIGHLLQNLLALFNRQTEFEKRLRQLEQLSTLPKAQHHARRGNAV